MYKQKQEVNRLPAAVSGEARMAAAPHRSGQSWDDPMLHVALVCTNPCRWDTRRRLFLECRRHLETFSSVRVHV
jgi:hypothetical protein